MYDFDVLLALMQSHIRSIPTYQANRRWSAAVKFRHLHDRSHSDASRIEMLLSLQCLMYPYGGEVYGHAGGILLLFSSPARDPKSPAHFRYAQPRPTSCFGGTYNTEWSSCALPHLAPLLLPAASPPSTNTTLLARQPIPLLHLTTSHAIRYTYPCQPTTA